MMSVLFLEQPGRWRVVTTTILLLLVALPLLPLARAVLVLPNSGVDQAFWQSLATSAEVALGGALVGFALGLPLGVGSALAPFPGRRFVLAAISLPLVVPSFLWAIGWSTLAAHHTFASPLSGGLSGCIIVAATTTSALVVFTSYAATLELSRSQLDAVRLAAGEGALVRRASRHALLPALFAAALGAVLSLSDPGPGQILGTHTVAAEILTTFAARYDLALAAKQCFVLTLVVAGLTLPLAWVVGPRLAQAVLARQLAAPSPRRQSPLNVAVALGTGAFLFLAVAPPVAGLLLPLVGGEGEGLTNTVGLTDDAWNGNHVGLVLLGALATAVRTAFNTILYAGGAGALAALLAFAIALAVGRSARLRTTAVSACLVLFAWPPAAGALAVAHLATMAPAELDGLVRSRFTVCLVLALHLTPVATALALRGVGAIAPSWTYAAAIHGVGVRRYFHRVLWPALRRSAAISVALVALLASADAGTVLLLHPPGEASLPLAIFTVMANAPEASVAALCLVYLLATVALLAGAIGLGSPGSP